MRDPGGVELFLSMSTIEDLKAEQRIALRNRADVAVDRLLQEIQAIEPRIADVATEDGARRMTSAIFLLRAAGLLQEVRGATAAPVLQVLGMRSAFELAVVGRYLAVHKSGVGEFRRRYNASLTMDAKLARLAGTTAPPPADFLAELITSDAKEPRVLFDIARDLDAVDGRQAEDNYSLQACYRLLHQFVSNAASHANVSSIKRYARRDGTTLLVEPAPDPIFSEAPELIVAAVIADLARDIFSVMGLPTDALPSEIVRPWRQSNGEEVD